MSRRFLHRTPARGFTLVELLVVITIFTIVLGAVGRLLLTTQRAYVQQRESSAALGPLRRAEVTLSGILRGASSNPNQLITVASGRRPPGIYALTSPVGGLRIVSDFNPPDGSLDAEFEDVQTWVANDTLWVSWQNIAGTPAPAQPVAAPVTSVSYTFLDGAGQPVTPNTTTNVAAARVRVTITVPRRIGATTTSVRRESWIVLRN